MSAADDTRRLAGESLAEGDPTGWFEKLYAGAADGAAEVPWDRSAPSALLVEWATGLSGAGARALVVGCGHGRDAEFVAGLGFDTIAFDISETAIKVAQERHPGTPVDYQVANLLDLPPEWSQAFDLVVESNNVQALPRSLRPRATAAAGTPVAPGGTLLVLAAGTVTPASSGPPWPLTRAEVEAFATGGLTLTTLDQIAAPDDPLSLRWRATFTRGRS